MKVLLPAVTAFLFIVGFKVFNLDEQLKNIIAKNQLIPQTSAPVSNTAKVELGRALFFDKILSGNKDISCATCHHPGLNSGDQLRLPIGVGGVGLGEERQIGEGREFIPRNSPEIFNRGSDEWHTMFWDGRVSGSHKTGFSTPADDSPAAEKFPKDIENVLSAQAMFPVTSRDEMRGDIGDKDINGEINELALISNAAPQSVWLRLMKRLLAIPEYVKMFKEAYPDVPNNRLGFQHAANAIAAFEIEAFTFSESPWDNYLADHLDVLSESAKRGAVLFFEKANCSTCHSGNLLTDQDFHNIGVPQFGPGKDNAAPLDPGRYLETGDPGDLFAFRTPPLRNVAITGPWMHNGAYTDLRKVIEHHIDPEFALRNYQSQQLPEHFQATYKGDSTVINKVLGNIDSRLNTRFTLTAEGVSDLISFLHALTDSAALDLKHIIPSKVPSGLDVESKNDLSEKISY